MENRKEEKNTETKNIEKQIVEKWELFFIVPVLLLFGFYLGFSLGASTSWVVPILKEKYEFMINFPVFLGLLIVIYIVINCIKSHRNHQKEVK